MPPKPDPVGEGEGPDPAMEEEKELVERELVISHLHTRLARYQSRGKALATLNTDLIDELETQKVNLQDINSYLTNELRAKQLATGEMEARVADLAKELDELRDLGETRLRGVEEEAKEQQSHLRADIQAFEREMKELDAFSLKRDALDAELTEKEALLALQRENHAARVDEISRKSSAEKDRLKKELALRIKDTKANMKKMTDAQLEMTTKRTIIENEQMGSELVYQARQTEKLLDRNEHLASEHQRMAEDLEEARAVERELAKRNHVFQKTIRTLTTKLSQQEEAIRYDTAAMARGEGELKVLTRRLEEVRRERNALVTECAAAAADGDEAADEVRVGAAARDECARFLEACARDIDQRMHAARAANDTSSDVDVLAQRRRALDYLLDKINQTGPGALYSFFSDARGGGPRQGHQQAPGGRTGGGLSTSELFARPAAAAGSGGGPLSRGGAARGVGGRGLRAAGGAGAGGAPAAVLPPIHPAGGGSFAAGVGRAPTGAGCAGGWGGASEGSGAGGGGGGSQMFLGGEGNSSAAAGGMQGGGGGGGGNVGGSRTHGDNGYGGVGVGGGGSKVDAAVQTASSGEQPAMWKEAAAAGSLHQVWSTSVSGSVSATSVGSKGGAGGRTPFGGGDSFGRSGMKQSYNFSGRRK